MMFVLILIGLVAAVAFCMSISSNANTVGLSLPPTTQAVAPFYVTNGIVSNIAIAADNTFAINAAGFTVTDTGSVGQFQIATNGSVTVSGSSGLFINIASVSGSLKINGTAVVKQQITGWADPTGTTSKATFDQSTVTLPVLAQHLAQLILDLKTHGLIGT